MSAETIPNEASAWEYDTQIFDGSWHSVVTREHPDILGNTYRNLQPLFADRSTRPAEPAPEAETIPAALLAIVEDRADWLIDAAATASQNRILLRGDEECDNVLVAAVYENAKKAIMVAVSRILADRSTRPAEPAPEVEVGRDCERCQGNGEIVEDWDKYLHGEGGLEQADHGVADCPDCGGEGKVDVAPEVEVRDRESLVQEALKRLILEREDANGKPSVHAWNQAYAALRCMEGSTSPADQIIGEIEKRFPNWRSYRDLIDCIDCTMHADRSTRPAEPAAPVAEGVRDTWFTDRALPVMAMSGDAESDRVLKLHFRRPVTDADRQNLCDAMNLHQRSLNQVAEAGDGEVSLADACKPWEFASGPVPDYDSPLYQVFVAGMLYTEQLLANHLGVKRYDAGDGSEDFDRDATMSLVNILTEAGLWDKDEWRSTLEAERARADAAEQRAADALDRAEKAAEDERDRLYAEARGMDGVDSSIAAGWLRYLGPAMLPADRAILRASREAQTATDGDATDV